jgi:hypothetical protein
LKPLAKLTGTGVTATVANPIYHYRASDELGEEAWETLRDAVATEVVKYGQEWSEIKIVLREWEDEYKKSTGFALPGAYRSAKSVLKNAILLRLPFAGSAKSALEKLIKQKKEADKEPLDPRDKAIKMAEKFCNYCETHNMDASGIFKSVNTKDHIR